MARSFLLLSLLLVTSSAQAQQVSAETEARAREMEGRLRAPCCWNQTIDIHSSPAAQEMRVEIRERLEAGESPEAIERTYVERYGERILAVPEGNPLGIFALGAILLALLAGGAVVVLGIRWRRRGAIPAASEPSSSAPEESDELDARLDAELGERF